MELDLENAVFIRGPTYLDMIGKAEVSLEGLACYALMGVIEEKAPVKRAA